MKTAQSTAIMTVFVDVSGQNRLGCGAKTLTSGRLRKEKVQFFEMLPIITSYL